eukprot:3932638-Rhodomonas_salina.1
MCIRDSNTSVAYTPDIAPTAVANFTAGVMPALRPCATVQLRIWAPSCTSRTPGKPGSLWISVDWEQFDHLHALEANMDAAVCFHLAMRTPQMRAQRRYK